MPRKISFLKECTETCKSSQHVGEFCSSITLPPSSVSDKQLACYLKSKCYNFANIRDPVGRTVLHIAASCGRRELCLWLCKSNDARIDEKDTESGYTALRRSVLYGHIDVAVTLIQLGADLSVKDQEDHLPLDGLCREVNSGFALSLIHSRISFDDAQNPVVLGKKANVIADYATLYNQSMEKYDLLSRMFFAFACEVYTWGTNLNYTSGFGAENSKLSPEYLEFFEKKNEIILRICMHKCHTLFISLSGNVWSCGLGKGGRLGLTSEDTVLIPQKVVLTSVIPYAVINPSNLFCIAAAVGQDHSIFLCNDNQVLTCGTNTYHQLGINPSVPSVSKPQAVKIDPFELNILGVAASTYHSVIWTCCTIYTCGLHAGQLGHPLSDDKTVPYFQKVRRIDLNFPMIEEVVVTEGATLVVTSDFILVFSNYNCHKIDLRPVIEAETISEFEYLNRRHRVLGDFRSMYRNQYARAVERIKVAAFGGTLDLKKTKLVTNSYHPEQLRIVLQLSNGRLFLWSENATQFIEIHFLTKRDVIVTDVILNSIGMLICTKDGYACIVKLRGCVETFSKRDDGFTLVTHRENEKGNQCYLAELERIPNAHRAMFIASNPKGDNFAMLQYRSLGVIDKWPLISESTLYADIELLLRETSDCDPFHDVIYQVGKKSFAAHEYIMASCSEAFIALKKSDGVVPIHGIHPEIFEQILLFAYTRDCCLLHEGPCSIKIRRVESEKLSVHRSPGKFEDPLRLTIAAAQEFKITEFVSMLENFRYTKDARLFKRSRQHLVVPLVLSRLKFKTLYDVKLQSQDGHILLAHKCVLVARMEYFKMMLCGNWIESTQNKPLQMPVSGPVLLEILEYLYTDTVTKVIFKKDVNFWCSLFVAADQFMLERLKTMSENALARCLDVRNVVDVLLFADVMRSNALKMACFDFISLNVPSCLESRILDKLNDTLLNDLSAFFKNSTNFTYSINDWTKPCTLFEAMPVCSDTCPEDVRAAESVCPINWDVIFESSYEDEPRNVLQKPKKKNKRKPIRKSSTSESESTTANNGKTELGEMRVNTLKYNAEIGEVAVNTSSVESKELPKEDWVTVNRQVKSVKSRLKANATIREFPELLEQKENFTPLTSRNSPSNTEPLEEAKMNSISIAESPRNLTYTIDIDLLSITPKLSQAARKRLRKASESARVDGCEPSSPEKVWDKKSSPASEEISNNLSRRVCWGTENQEVAASFSSIMASEKKEKTLVMKETKKIETKPLNLTQMEDKAIQELTVFYNAHNVDDEHITVRRIIHKTTAPQWVTK